MMRSLARPLRLFVLLCALGIATEELRAQVLPVGTRFVMSHFKANEGGGDERLFISHSMDGLNWTALNGGLPVWQPPGWATFYNVVRDPAITWANGYYWVAYTSGNYGRHNSFGLLKSVDLLAWTFVGEIAVPLPGGTDQLTWGPIFFEDGDGSIHVFVSLDPNSGATYGPSAIMGVHETHPVNADWTQWSAPVPVGLPSPTTNELWVWKEGPLYQAVYVDFRIGSPIVHATSANLLTGWGSAHWVGYQAQEGPMVFPIPGGGYRLYLEGGNSALSPGYRTCDCNAGLTTFTEQVAVNSTVPMRNGKIVSARKALSFAQWQTQELGAVPAEQREPLADPDGDLLPNQLEHSLGGDPLAFTSPGAPLEVGTRRIDGALFGTVNFSWLRSSSDTTAFAEVRRLPSTPWSSAAGDLVIESKVLQSDGLTRVFARTTAPAAAGEVVLFRIKGAVESPAPPVREGLRRRLRR